MGRILSIPAVVLRVAEETLPPEPPEWVPVRECVPELGQKVVMYSRESGPWVGVYQGDGTKHRWSSFYSLSVDSVTHWFPMPETPAVSRRNARKI
jgi:hypothetical protein